MEELQSVFTPGVFVFLVIVLAIGMLIPSVCLKWVMRVIFVQEVSFGLILLMFVINGVLSLAVMIWFSAGYRPEMASRPEIFLLLAFASYAVLLAQLTAFVPNRDMEVIAMWKWAVGLVVQYLILLALSFALHFVVYQIGLSQRLAAASL